MQVQFYDRVDESLLKFAVIISKYNGKFVFCKHKDRDTLEIPGGHRETNEKIEDAASRELWEETGAKEFDLKPICVYSVIGIISGVETYGMLYYANIKSFEDGLHSEN